MKHIKTFFLASCCISVFLPLNAPGAEEWDDLKALHLNTEKTHATMITYPDTKSAVKGDCKGSPWFKLLNGNWKFYWSKNPAERPKDFFKPDFGDSSWKKIPVPSNWQIHGYGTPIYLNIRYPFPKRPPKAPRKYNPVGSYRTKFTVPDSWNERRTLIHFDGVNSAFYLWINGQKVGYSQSSRTLAEFDITKYLKEEKNLLACPERQRQGREKLAKVRRQEVVEHQQFRVETRKLQSRETRRGRPDHNPDCLSFGRRKIPAGLYDLSRRPGRGRQRLLLQPGKPAIQAGTADAAAERIRQHRVLRPGTHAHLPGPDLREDRHLQDHRERNVGRLFRPTGKRQSHRCQVGSSYKRGGPWSYSFRMIPIDSNTKIDEITVEQPPIYKLEPLEKK